METTLTNIAVKQEGINPNYLVCFIILLMTISQMAVTIYLPAMPSMAIHLATSSSTIQLSLILFIFAYGFSQFFYGPLSDIYGRRLIILVGLSIFIIATFIASIATNIYIFLIARVLQGIGIGCGDTMGRAILCDTFKGHDFVKAASYISMAATLTPLFAPILGGYFDFYFGWRACFIFLLAYGLICLVLIKFYLPETNSKRYVIKLSGILNRYSFIIRNRIFLGFFIPGLVSFFGETIYSMISPFLLQNKLGYSAVAFGWLTIYIVGGLLIGALIAKILAHKVSHQTMVFCGLCILLLGGFSMLIPALGKWMTVSSIVFPMVIFTIGVGITYPNTNMGALAPFTAMAGTAGALQGGMQMFITGFAGIGLARIHEQDQLPLALILTLCACVGLICFKILLKSASPYDEAVKDDNESPPQIEDTY